jgi:hypothetical protein
VRGVARLHAVAVVGAFARNPVGQLVQVRLARDDRTRSPQMRRDSGVSLGRSMQIAVKNRTARGLEAGQVEAVLQRNGNTPQRLRGDA